MKAAQAVITPKPMPKAKATIRAAQDVPKAFQDKSFQDRTRIREQLEQASTQCRQLILLPQGPSFRS